MRPFAIICVLVYLFVKFVNSQEGCTFTLTGKFSPIFLDPYNTTMLRPRNGKFLFGYGDQFTIYCPVDPDIKNKEKNNFYKPTYYTSPSLLTEVLAQCAGGQSIILIFVGEQQDLSTCSRIIEGTVIDTNRPCGQKNQGTMLNIGYSFKSTCFMPIIKVCYIIAKYATLFTLHVIHGEDIRNSPRVPHFFGYSENFAEKSEKAYNKPDQQAMWEHLIGNDPPFPNDNYLMDGHLTPYLDFINTNCQYTSKYSITVIPIWRTIYKGNWRKIEGMIRRLANNLRDALVMYSGTHEIFSMQRGNQSKELFLMDNHVLPVPKFMYKLIYYKAQRKAMVIIVSNNPFQDDKLPGDIQKCTGVCEKFGWESKTFLDRNIGRAYCCPYEYLVENFPNSPSILVTGLLEGPQTVKPFDFFQDFDKDSGNIVTTTAKSSSKSTTTKAGNASGAG